MDVATLLLRQPESPGIIERVHCDFKDVLTFQAERLLAYET